MTLVMRKIYTVSSPGLQCTILDVDGHEKHLDSVPKST